VAGRGCGAGGDGEGDLTNVQCKAVENCHNEIPHATKNSNKNEKKERYQ
jgi:hypothetical protein